MEPYNIKVITYPDLTKQVRIYSCPIGPPDHVPVHRPRDKDPFDGKCVHEVYEDLDEWEYYVSDVSLKRTRRKVYDYAKCNEWDWFVTFTFDGKKVDRYDYDVCVSKLSKWLNNLKRSSPALSYLIVPERHKDGAWHFHGLFAGLLEGEVVDTGRTVIKRLKTASGRSRFKNTGVKIYQIGRYKLGWMTATRVVDRERVTSYITKYITKDMLDGLYGRKRYWCSRGLLLPVEEVFAIDDVSRFMLASELSEVARYRKVSTVSYGDMAQSVGIYEV